MPPHERMSLTQQLLLRSLIARFWRTPYEPARLTRWGTELHDRFMLPYFVEQDFADVMVEQQAGRVPACARIGLHPTSSSAFPSTANFGPRGRDGDPAGARALARDGRGRRARRHRPLRRLLGRAAAGEGNGAAARPLCHRLQRPACAPAPTGNVGEFVAGVRYKAWQPASALHPTKTVDSPLTFDLVDTWMKRSLGGCQYHVMHPGGRNYATFPVNAFESESRRLARFFRMGHTPGTVWRPPEPAESRVSLHAGPASHLSESKPKVSVLSAGHGSTRTGSLAALRPGRPPLRRVAR